ncbi:helix-turn-helix transcriptional regulator [Streptomyces racemochromogenes]|uniref:Helix-turn-helix transcriptional regulator n=1 Tax=Streptomyces racemochromogenes TaxID=67353 RepID=A0ABW7PFC2_9ACTN
MLHVLGLDTEAEDVYRLLLGKPELGVEGVAGTLGLPPRRIREILDRLADLALLAPSWNAAEGIRPVSPEVALNALLARRNAEVLRAQRDIEGAKSAIDDLLSSYRAPEEADPLAPERLLGLEATRLRLEQLAAEITTEALAFAPGGPQPPDNRNASRPLVEAALERGVSVRTVYLDSVCNDVESRAHAERLVALGGQVRTVPALPMRMQILDRRFALVPIDPEDSPKGAVLLKEPGAVTGLLELFERIWEQAVPLGDTPAAPAPLDATPQERALLGLLSDGLTDEAAARKLGVSLRTERRMITDLMKRLDATSRFQLGQQAAKHGLLPPPR